MGTIIILLEVLVFLIILIPCLLFNFQLVFGSLVNRKKLRTGSLNTFKVLMPAHNEASIIAATLEKLERELGSLNDVIVIADNCNDNTANIARELGSTVIERFDEHHKGKGYALNAGFIAISDDLPTTIVVLDADCYFSPGSFSQLVLSSQQTDSVIQALYLMKSPDGGSVKTRVAEFAWLVKNQIRANALTQLGINCQLQGSGMAFPSRVFKQVSFASGSIVEDLELGLKLTAINESIRLNTSSEVTSFFPTSAKGSEDQRTRWEHGHLSSIRSLSKMAIGILFNKKISTFFSILDAMLPPTVLWLLIVCASCVLTALISLAGHYAPFYLCAFSFSLMLVGLFICWYSHGRAIISSKDAGELFGFVFSKLSLYKSFIYKRQKEWIKTDRGEQ